MTAALGPTVNKIRNSIKKNGSIKKTISEELSAQISAIGLRAFYSSRDDYSKYRTATSSIDKYIGQAKNSICMVSITLATGISFDDICKVFKAKLRNKDFTITVSLLNPYKDELYQALELQFGQPAKALQGDTINTLRSLKNLRTSLKPDEQERFIIKVHQSLPFGSAIILDGNSENGTIQIETKPYGVGMRKSFAFEIGNNDGEFYDTIKSSYNELINDGIKWDEL